MQDVAVGADGEDVEMIVVMIGSPVALTLRATTLMGAPTAIGIVDGSTGCGAIHAPLSHESTCKMPYAST